MSTFFIQSLFVRWKNRKIFFTKKLIVYYQIKNVNKNRGGKKRACEWVFWLDLSFLFLAFGMMADQNGEISGGRKESNCVRCRNHLLKVVLRGHKQYCPYAACTCDKCRFTAEQQRQMRLQNAIRRSEANDRTGTPGRRPRNAANAPPAMVSPPQQQQQLPQPQQVIQHQVVQVQQQPPVAQQHQPHQIIVTTAVAVPIPNSDQRNGGSPHGMYPLLAQNQFSIRIINFILSVLCFAPLCRREENVIRLFEWTAKEISLSLGDDAYHVRAG